MKSLITILVGAVIMLSVTVSAARPALADTCVVTVVNGPDSNCGPYFYPQFTASNGYNTYVGIDGWACGPADQQNPDGTNCGPTNLTVINPGDFTLTTTESGSGVLMYPSAYQLYGSLPLSQMQYVRSVFTESMPHNSTTVAWAAYDIFLNNAGPNNEVMIKPDQSNDCQSCAPTVGQATFWGQSWTLHKYGGELIWDLGNGTINENTGTVHILAMLRWLQSHGFITTTSRLGIIGFGWEIVSTGGVPEIFTVSSLSLNTSPADSTG